MNVCPNCGAPLKPESKFCSSCGASVVAAAPVEPEYAAEPVYTPEYSAEPVYTPEYGAEPVYTPEYGAEPAYAEQPYAPDPGYVEEPPKKRKKTGLIVTIVAVIAVIGAAAFLFLRWYMSDEQQILRAIEAGDYEGAVDILDESDLDEDVLEDALSEKIGEIRTAFTNNEMEFDDAIEQLEGILELDVGDTAAECEEAILYVQTLNDSRISFETAEGFMEDGKYPEAIAQYDLVWEDDPNYDTATARKEEAIDAYRDEVLAEAADYAADENYADAVVTIVNALEVLPEDPELTEQLSIYESNLQAQNVDSALELAESYAESGNYEKAMETIEEAMDEFGSTSALTDAYDEYLGLHIDSVIAEADEKANAGDFLAAMDLVQDTMDEYGSDAELESAYDRYADGYAEMIMLEAEGYVQKGDYNSAIAVLKDGLEVLPGNADLQEMLESVEGMKPVPITNLTPINGGFVWNNTAPVDPFGNDYSTAANYAVFEISNDNDHGYGGEDDDYRVGTAEYRVYGKYDTLSMTLAPYTSVGENGYSYVQVYADGELVYTSQNVTRKTDAFTIEANIAGAEYIEIKVYMYYVAYYAEDRWGATIISDVMLIP